jgi:membrane-associated phospholipid phosphatase
MSISLAYALLHASVLQAAVSQDSGFWRKGDAHLAIATVAATATLAVFDERIAHWMRQSSVQGDSSRHDKVLAATVVNEMPLTLAAIAAYGVGRLTRAPTVADVGAHLTESLAATILIVESILIPLGRARPRVSLDDAFDFHPGGGWRRFEYRAFPSLHAAAAFTTAAALCEEMRLRKANARRYVCPSLFVAATIPGFTRLYLDQHWATDILAGSVIGAFLGTRVVRYSHGRQTKIDRLLLPERVAVNVSEISVMWSISH